MTAGPQRDDNLESGAAAFLSPPTGAGGPSLPGWVRVKAGLTPQLVDRWVAKRIPDRNGIAWWVQGAVLKDQLVGRLETMTEGGVPLELAVQYALAGYTPAEAVAVDRKQRSTVNELRVEVELVLPTLNRWGLFRPNQG